MSEGEVPRFIYAPKIREQMERRGWTFSEIARCFEQPVKTAVTSDWRSGKDEPAVAYYFDETHYVVINSVTNEVVQISNRNHAVWHAPWDEPKRERGSHDNS